MEGHRCGIGLALPTRAREGAMNPLDQHAASERWLQYVASLPWQKGHLDEASYSAGLRAASLGISPERAFTEVCDRIRQAGDAPRSAKINAQLQRAYRYA